MRFSCLTHQLLTLSVALKFTCNPILLKSKSSEENLVLFISLLVY